MRLYGKRVCPCGCACVSRLSRRPHAERASHWLLRRSHKQKPSGSLHSSPHLNTEKSEQCSDEDCTLQQALKQSCDVLETFPYAHEGISQNGISCCCFRTRITHSTFAWGPRSPLPDANGSRFENNEFSLELCRCPEAGKERLEHTDEYFWQRRMALAPDNAIIL